MVRPVRASTTLTARESGMLLWMRPRSPWSISHVEATRRPAAAIASKERRSD